MSVAGATAAAIIVSHHHYDAVVNGGFAVFRFKSVEEAYTSLQKAFQKVKPEVTSTLKLKSNGEIMYTTKVYTYPTWDFLGLSKRTKQILRDVFANISIKKFPNDVVLTIELIDYDYTLNKRNWLIGKYIEEELSSVQNKTVKINSNKDKKLKR